MGKAEKALRPHDIDAFWLQRELRKYYDDPMTAQTKANEVLQILKVDTILVSVTYLCLSPLLGHRVSATAFQRPLSSAIF